MSDKLKVTLSAKQLEVIHLLVLHKHEKTYGQIEYMAGIKGNQIPRWMMDPTFRDAYKDAVDRWTADLMDVKYANKKNRILELERLLAITPDASIEKIIQAKSRIWDPDAKRWIEMDAIIVNEIGNPLLDNDGVPVRVLAVMRSNVDAKVKLLEQIRVEVEPKITAAMLRRESDGSSSAIVFSTGMPADFPTWGDAKAPLDYEAAEKVEDAKP